MERKTGEISYGFAKYLRDALPNASFIGFTGTPIEKEDVNTPAVFGEYIDVYDINRGGEDGATVPIYYESRIARIELDEDEKPKLDAEVAELTEEEAEGEQEKLKGSVAKFVRIGEFSALDGVRSWRMNDFKGRHFGGEIVLWAVRWYCRYPISYRDLEAMMTERGVAVDHSTIYRWVQRFAPEMEKRLRWQWRRPRSRSWRIDETYVRVRGQWAYLYRALDKFGNTLDFYLSSTRNTKAAKRFLGKALNGWKDWELPEVLNTDKAPTYAGAIAELKAEGKCPNETRHRQVKSPNNVVEADHGKLKLLLRPVRGFKTLKTAYATIKGFEVMRALRKGQAGIFALQDGIVGEARIVERAFGLGPCALPEVMALLQNRLANAEA